MKTHREDRWRCRYRRKSYKNNVIKKFRKLQKPEKCFLDGLSAVKTHRVLCLARPRQLSRSKITGNFMEKADFQSISPVPMAGVCEFDHGEEPKTRFPTFLTCNAANAGDRSFSWKCMQLIAAKSKASGRFRSVVGTAECNKMKETSAAVELFYYFLYKSISSTLNNYLKSRKHD